MLETAATGEGGKENLAGVFLRETTSKSYQHSMSSRQISNCHLTMSSTELATVTEVLGKKLGSDRTMGDRGATAEVEWSQNRMSTRHISNCLLTILEVVGKEGFGFDLTTGNTGAITGVERTHETEVGVAFTGVTGTWEMEIGVVGVETGARAFFETGDFLDSWLREERFRAETELSLEGVLVGETDTGVLVTLSKLVVSPNGDKYNNSCY
jgi:hypothetical protein